jgi:predicted nucleic acid-binding protein
MRGSASTAVVADVGPLIGLAKIGRLDLLRRLFRRVLIPGGVETELRIESSRPGSLALAAAREAGWLAVVPVPHVPARLLAVLGRGEAEAIVLAERESALLMIDESRGRVAARIEGVRIFGTGAVLIEAKRRKLIQEAGPVLDALQDAGYRISSALHTEISRLAGEYSECRGAGTSIREE